MSAADYERGYHDGARAALRLEVERICDPAARWGPQWKPAAYRIAALLASEYFGGAVPVRGEMHPEFGGRQLSVHDFTTVSRETGVAQFWPASAGVQPRGA